MYFRIIVGYNHYYLNKLQYWNCVVTIIEAHVVMYGVCFTPEVYLLSLSNDN